MLPFRKLLFLANWERTCLAHSVEARLVFSGRSPLGHDVLLYLCRLPISCAAFFSVGSLLGNLLNKFFCVCWCPGPEF